VTGGGGRGEAYHGRVNERWPGSKGDMIPEEREKVSWK